MLSKHLQKNHYLPEYFNKTQMKKHLITRTIQHKKHGKATNRLGPSSLLPRHLTGPIIFLFIFVPPTRRSPDRFPPDIKLPN